MFRKGSAAKQAAIDEYFKHWDNKPAENETQKERAVRCPDMPLLFPMAATNTAARLVKPNTPP